MRKLLFVRLLSKITHRIFTPPLGLLYVMRAVKQDAPDIDFKLFDNVHYNNPEKEFKKVIREYKPDMIGFSLHYTERDWLKTFSKITRKVLPQCKIVTGGPGATYTPAEFLPMSDFVVSGEGEERILNIISYIKGDTDNLMDGITYKKDGEIISKEQFTYLKDLDRWGVPAWEELDIKKYAYYPCRNTVVKRSPHVTIMTSRGCPFNCPWCHNYTDSKYANHRVRSVENVRKELELLEKLGVKEIHFLDDTINIPEDRAYKMFRMIKDDFDFTFGIQGIRLDYAPKKLLKLIHSAGGYKLDFGVQHVVSKITRNLERSNVPELNTILKKHRYAKDLGFITCAFFIYGFPEETFKDSLINLKFAKKLDTDFIGFFKLTPLPGTKYYNEEIRNADIPSIDFNHFSNNPILQVGDLSREEMEYLQSKSYREYYLSRGRIFRLLYKIPKTKYLFLTSFHYFKSMITAFLEKE